MITVELVKMLRRPRTWVIIAMLVALLDRLAVLNLWFEFPSHHGLNRSCFKHAAWFCVEHLGTSH